MQIERLQWEGNTENLTVFAAQIAQVASLVIENGEHLSTTSLAVMSEPTTPCRDDALLTQLQDQLNLTQEGHIDRFFARVSENAPYFNVGGFALFRIGRSHTVPMHLARHVIRVDEDTRYLALKGW